MKTRTAKTSSTPVQTTEEASSKALPPTVATPPNLFVLPSSISHDARIVSLVDHSTCSLRRYIFDPNSGVCEIKRIAAPKRAPRTWLLGRSRETTDRVSHTEDDAPLKEKEQGTSSERAPAALNEGYVMRDAALFVATSLDPLFLLSPIFENVLETEKKGRPQQFLSEDDHLERLSQSSKHMNDILGYQSFRKSLLQRLSDVSLTQPVGDETYYKPDLEKLVDVLIQKAKAINSRAWPSSLEEDFVSKPLFVPDTSIDREEKSSMSFSGSSMTDLSQSSTNPPDLSAGPSQDSSVEMPDTPVADADITSIKTTDDGVDAIQRDPSNPSTAPEEIKQSLRERTVLNYIMSSYFSASMRDSLEQKVNASAKLNFQALNDHLETTQKLRNEVIALRSLSENISRKRTLENEEMAEIRAEKKRKKEEEEKKKKEGSRALKDLKKADTSGMKKLSSFFTKAAPKTTSG